MKDDYVRVSDVLKIISKYDGVPEDKLIAAAEKGTAIHSWLTSYLLSQKGDFPVTLDDLQEDYQSYGTHFLEWVDAIGEHEVYAMEERFYDEDLMITGEVDLIIKKDNKYTLIDVKTTYAKGKDWGLQLAAYAYLVMRNRSISFDDLQILHLKKDGEYKIYSYDFQEHFPIFMKCYDLYKYFNKKRRPKEF